MTFRTLGAFLAEVTPTPSPTELNTDLVTPGVVGFVVTFAVALLVILLIVDMVRRVRRVNYRAQINEDLDAEERESGDGGAEDPRDDSSDSGDGPRREQL